MGETTIEEWQRGDADLPLRDLLIKHPVLVQSIFARHDHINMIVHPVTPSHDASGQQVLNVATMRRRIGNESPIMSMQVRYMEDQVDVLA